MSSPQRDPHRHLSHYVSLLLNASIHQRDPREAKRHNVEVCHQCGTKIGRGRAGRRCAQCRAQEGTACDR